MENQADCSGGSQDCGATVTALKLAPAAPPRYPVDAMLLWSALCSGSLRFVEQYEEQHCTLLVLQQPSHLPRPIVIQGRRRRVLEALLSGMSQMAVALELGFAPATICEEFKAAMRCLGLSARLSSVPLPLSQLWHAAAFGCSVNVRRGAGLHEAELTTVVLPSCDALLASRLSPGERDVCRLLLLGKTHAQIASVRGTARRTIANQLGSTFTKLRISGRLELIALLAKAAATELIERAPASAAAS
jgi:DNA-binding NarL/FixJ family response regulator